jgi:hypothetical protein
MNDEHDDDRDDATSDPELEPALEPAQDARIRALLAELGSGPDGEPLPLEVAARLDDTLALLVAERGRTQDESASDNVVPLRRRWLPRAAVAAAAVIVLGAGGVVVGNLGNMSPTGEKSSSDSAGQSTAEAPNSSGDSSGESGSDSGTGAAALPELSATTFASDVTTLLEGRTLLRTPEGKAAGDQSTQQNRESAEPDPPEAFASRACPGPKVTDGAVANPVRYDGRPAVLLIHPEQSGRQVVDAWNCAGDRRLASTTVKR